MNTDIEILYSTTADDLAVGDQTIIDGDLVIIRSVDKDRDDIDEVFVTFENLSDPTVTDAPLYADDEYEIWSI